MTAPKIGDVVRLGDLPAGSECETSDGVNRERWIVRQHAVDGRGTIVARVDSLLTPAAALVRVYSLPPPVADAPPAEESAAVAHWHRKATDLEAALARMTADQDSRQRDWTGRWMAVLWALHVVQEDGESYVDVTRRACKAGDDLRADLARVTAERDAQIGLTAAATETADAAVRERDDARRIVDHWTARIIALTGARIGVEPLAAVRHIVTDRDECANERDAALAQVTALQEAVAENGRLRAECDRLRTAAAHYATTRRDRDAVATICEALGIAQTPYPATPDGALLAIRDLRAELSEHAARTQEAREMLRNSERYVDKIAEALGGTVDGEAVIDAAKRLRSWVAIVDETIATRLATRDAQEGDRIAAWERVSGWPVCPRCWYPADGVDGLCAACVGDDERAVPAKCSGCPHVSEVRDYCGLSYCTHPERMGMTVFEYEAPPDRCPLRIAVTRDERASAEEGGDA